MTSKSYQFDGIQALRLFAALLVVTTHSFFYSTERLGAQSVMWGNGARGVDIFFVISGFVMIIASRNLVGTQLGWAKFAIQRAIRIIPLYWIVTSIKVLVMIFSTSLVLHAELDLDNIIGSYFFIPYKKDATHVEPLMGVGWTLIFEMFFYLVFSIALLLRVNVYIFVGFVMIVLSMLSLMRPIDYPVWMYLFNPMVLEFWLGMIIGYFVLKGKLIKARYAVLLLILSTAWIMFSNEIIIPEVISIGISAVVLVYSVVSLESFLKPNISKYVLFLSAASYSLYLVHPIFAPMVPVLMSKIGVRIFGLSVFLSVLFSIGVAILTYMHIESPITNYLKKSFLMSIFKYKSSRKEVVIK
jgi:exopolysaccharide production protein ExoZ